MQESTKTYFVSAANEKLKEHFAKQGIIIRDNNKDLEDTAIEIGELYYELKRKEDLI